MKSKLVARLIVLVLIIIVGIAAIYNGVLFRLPSLKNIEEEAENWLALPIPELLQDENPDPNVADFTLLAQQGETSFFDGVKTRTMGYNGNFLGPVIKVSQGETVNMHVKNDLNQSTSIHWHGLEVPGSEDGGPHQVIQSGSTWNPSFMIDQAASTLWFHPHVIGTTATQVYYGLAGMLWIEDENSASLNLPNTYGVNDIPLIIQDRSFDRDGSFYYIDNGMDGARGDYILVNGAITPHLNVNQIKMRFRILNGANASNFDLSLSNQNEMIQIASDGGLLNEAVIRDNIFISPGERAEIIIDFSNNNEGDVIALMSGQELVMTFKVGVSAKDDTFVNDKLARIERMDESLATGLKTIELDGMGHMVSLNGRQFDMNRIDDDVQVNAVEIWEITANQSMMGTIGHPFHIHGTQFQILSRDNKVPEAHEMGWKDTVFVNAGETVRIIVQFKHKGIYMYHCHILEHEEAGMMGQLEVR